MLGLGLGVSSGPMSEGGRPVREEGFSGPMSGAGGCTVRSTASWVMGTKDPSCG